MKACSVVTTKKQKPPGTANTGGLLGLVLTALEVQTVKPLAQEVGYNLCSNRLNKRDEGFHGSTSFPRLGETEKGRRNSIT